MLEKATVSGRSNPSVFYRQNSRQGMMLRSHQVSFGKWHFKSLMFASLILLVFLYYIHMAEERPGVRSQKRALVVRPAKPYKSPLSRRRHPKPHKDGKGVQPAHGIANVSLAQNKLAVDLKHNKSKALPTQQPAIATNKGALNNDLQMRAKYKNMHKLKERTDLPPFFQVSPIKNQHLGQFKTSDVKVGKKPLPYISPGGGKIPAAIKTFSQTGNNMQGSKVGVVLQSTKAPTVLRYLKNNNGSFHGLKPSVPNEVYADTKIQPANPGHDRNNAFQRQAAIPKPVMKMRSSLP